MSDVHVSSEKAMINELRVLADSGASMIVVRTRELIRAATAIRQYVLVSEESHVEWDSVNGDRRFTLQNYTEQETAGSQQDFFTSLQSIMNDIRDGASSLNANPEKAHYYVFMEPTPFLENPMVHELLRQLSCVLPVRNVALIFLISSASNPVLPEGVFMTVEMSTPTRDELKPPLFSLVEGVNEQGGNCKCELTDGEVDRILNLGAGLTLLEFETHIAIGISRAYKKGESVITAEHIIDGVSLGKIEVVKSSDILELMPVEGMENLGGMSRLKDWVTKRASSYSEEAKEFGVEAPKGVVLVGVPGTGKSLAAKTVASSLGLPLIRLDFGRVFSKFIGDSESRMRAALAMVEAMSPCVLFADEVDKGLGGIGAGGGDGGVSVRVLGTFLTWLQELKEPVFTILTANRVTGLPPELLRKGRFDEIFSVGLPNAVERREVLRIHLRKRGYELDDLATDETLEEFDAASSTYIPAEIEAAVKDGILEAFSTQSDMSLEFVISALRNTIPMSRSHKENVDAMIAWAEANAVSVSYPEGSRSGKIESARPSGSSTKRIVRVPRRR